MACFELTMDMYFDRCADRARENQANDISKLLAFFGECKVENPQFFCDYQLDKEGKIMSILWSHASQQGNYADFGDVFTFDTTHRTNMYDKPLAMFVGGSNHLKNIVFAFALLGDETTETFEWVFSTFKRCMGGMEPRVTLTGQRSYSIESSTMYDNLYSMYTLPNMYIVFINGHQQTRTQQCPML